MHLHHLQRRNTHQRNAPLHPPESSRPHNQHTTHQPRHPRQRNRPPRHHRNHLPLLPQPNPPTPRHRPPHPTLNPQHPQHPTLGMHQLQQTLVPPQLASTHGHTPMDRTPLHKRTQPIRQHPHLATPMRQMRQTTPTQQQMAPRPQTPPLPIPTTHLGTHQLADRMRPLLHIHRPRTRHSQRQSPQNRHRTQPAEEHRHHLHNRRTTHNFGNQWDSTNNRRQVP
jgi:hypothetical protein